MATEYEELRLGVTLVDNVSGQLEKIRSSLANMGGGQAGAGLDRIKRQSQELGASVKDLATHFTTAGKTLSGFALSAGAAAAGVIGLGLTISRSLSSLKQYADEMGRLGTLSTQLGIGAAQLKSMSEQFAQSGVDAGKAQANLAGLAGAMADIGRANSQLRQTLLRGQQGDDRAAMEALLGDLGRVANNPAQFANKVREAMDNVYANVLERTKSSTRAAEARKNFASVFGVPDLAQVRGQFAEVSAAADQMMATRTRQADEFNAVSVRIGQSWKSVGESVSAALLPLATFALGPIATGFENIAAEIESISAALGKLKLPDWLSASFEPPEWLKTVGNVVGGAVAKPAAQAVEAVNAASDPQWFKLGFKRPAWMGGGAAAPPLPPVRPAQTGIDAASAMQVPAFAAGGPIGAGELGVVGEQGPELFSPGSSGTILPNAMYAAALAAEYGFGVKGASTLAAGALGGATSRGSFGQTMMGMIPGVGLLKKMKEDAASGHSLRTKLRAMLGLEDPGEPAPWQVSGRQGGGPVTSGANYLVGEGGPELFMGRGGGGGQGARLISEQNRQMEELNQNTEGQNAQMRALTDELKVLNTALIGGSTGGGGVGGLPGGSGTLGGSMSGGGGGGVRMGGLGGLPGFGGAPAHGGTASVFAGGGGSSGGGGASASFATPTAGTSVGDGAGPQIPAVGRGTSATQAMDYFQSAGWTKEQSAGIVANLQHESQFKPDARGDSGKALGIAQWHSDRRAKIEKAFGKPVSQMNYQEQLAAVNWELTQGGEKRAGNLLRGATTPGQAGGIVSKHYERPLKRELEARERGRTAELVYNRTPDYAPPPPLPSGGNSPMGGGATAVSSSDAAGSAGAMLDREGKPPEAFVLHHTAGRGTPEGVVNWWKQQGKGIGTQYIMDRQGVVHDTAKEYGYKGTGQILPSTATKMGLSNRNTLGMEIIAKNDKDVTPEQAKAAAVFMRTHYPNTPVYGHGQLNPGHREQSEGMTAVRAIETERATRLARGDIDRKPLDADMGHEVAHKVEGTGHLSVDVSAPAGTKVAAEGGGLFKKTTVSRQTQMAPASEGPAVSV